MKKKTVVSMDDYYRFCEQLGMTRDEADKCLDDCRRLGLINEWIDEDGFYNFTGNEDIPLDHALMILNLGDD
jgi:hypothetical protein